MQANKLNQLQETSILQQISIKEIFKLLYEIISFVNDILDSNFLKLVFPKSHNKLQAIKHKLELLEAVLRNLSNEVNTTRQIALQIKEDVNISTTDNA